MRNDVGIVGLGHVGSIMNELFPNAYIYDEPKNIGTRAEINTCEFVFVCVPTPMSADGSCDTSIVDDVLSWLDPSIIILRSTVPVGYTTSMRIKRRYEGLYSGMVFQPEYYGETINHPFENPHNRPWITLGGDILVTKQVADLYKTVYTSDIYINQVDSKTAELAKYMENSFLATKVTFCNQFYDLANKFGINYDQLRETWLLDPRIGRSHTFVYPDDRGYGGSCLPKDTAAIIKQGEDVGVDMKVLKAVEEVNKEYHE